MRENHTQIVNFFLRMACLGQEGNQPRLDQRQMRCLGI